MAVRERVGEGVGVIVPLVDGQASNRKLHSVCP
jgi:hypothetical protein